MYVCVFGFVRRCVRMCCAVLAGTLILGTLGSGAPTLTTAYATSSGRLATATCSSKVRPLSCVRDPYPTSCFSPSLPLFSAVVAPTTFIDQHVFAFLRVGGGGGAQQHTRSSRELATTLSCSSCGLAHTSVPHPLIALSTRNNNNKHHPTCAAGGSNYAYEQVRLPARQTGATTTALRVHSTSTSTSTSEQHQH
jgi:hypothetical protein